MKAVVKVDIVDGKCVVIYSDGSEQELYEYPSDEGGGGGASLMDEKLISHNGEYSASSDGYDGYKKVNVNVVAPAPTLIRKNITENGVYKASEENADGFDQVTVNVSAGGGIDLTNAIGSYETGSFGSLFASLSQNNFGAIHKIITSGMNPIEVQLPTNLEIKGLLIYPINTPTADMANDNILLSCTVWRTTYNAETGNKDVYWTVNRQRGGNAGNTITSRVSSWTFINNKLSIVPQYPSNQNYNPFKFGATYAFLYWY